ncbi:putative chitin synthase activator (Chs3) [Aspergillus melleus]|uniref:putative chitin synthase activator (Chs3) n=1 Tax=Aspergillus melleus TaxID=138277 RepID=UPI001E8E90FC|nr:Chitin synthase 4 [Aspergillus melleus]KAH8429846.1 Chitin synthase 4 [Aspergillus melleus]
MASPVAGGYPQPVTSPPPVYLRSSPPASDTHNATPRSTHKRPLSFGFGRKSPTASVPLTDHVAEDRRVSRGPDDATLAPVFNKTVDNFPVDYDVPPLPTGRFSKLTVEEDLSQSNNSQIPDGPSPASNRDSYDAPPPPPSHLPQTSAHGHTPASSGSWSVVEPHGKEEPKILINASGSSLDQGAPSASHNSSSRGSLDSVDQVPEVVEEPEPEPLHYHHRPYQPKATPPAENAAGNGHLSAHRARSSRPRSAYSIASDIDGRNGSPHGSPYLHARSSSRHSASPDVRPVSFVDLLNTPYPQPGPAPAQFGNAQLQSSVGNSASLLSHKQTFDMYLANVKKTDDPATQYEFAIFMVNAMLEMPEDLDGVAQVYGRKGHEITRASLLKEAKSILQRLSDRSYPFAQYYLADGYASGLFNKGKEDPDRAFTLFLAASKHGHVEACYRTALCYEFGWGTRVEAARAQQFYRQAASKNHPGAMLRMAKACLAGDMGLGVRYREGVKWLKRATESSDRQYNSAPYELGLMHESGYGDDVFPDQSYAAQLFTKSADLGHVEASYRLGDAYEHGKLNCPRDPALSIHFYTGAAQGGHAHAMMALCAWYLVGAEPVLEKDENEAYEWAKRAADLGLTKAQYAVGYFTEMGIGCRRDPLEANVWYVKAAEQGDTRATHRIAAIRAAAEGVDPAQAASQGQKGKKEGKKRFGLF